MAAKIYLTEKKQMVYFLVTVICFVLCAALAIWFNNICGVEGLTHWHCKYRSLFLMLDCLVILPLLAFTAGIFFNSKAVRITGIIVSILPALVWTALFGFLTVVSLSKVKTGGVENLNILRADQPLPSHKEADGSFMHYAWSSDPHWGTDTSNIEVTNKILRNIDKRNYDACFITGDMVEYGMFVSDYETACSDIRANLKNTPLRVVAGNHDTVVNSLPVFRRTFMEKGCNDYYRMDNGKVHFIFLKLLWDLSEWSKKQEQWLIEQLEQIPEEDTVVVVSHCYIISSGYYDPLAKKTWGDIPEVVQTLCPILEKYKVDLHISGHDHFYEYSEKDGVSYAVIGTMGSKLDTDFCYYTPYSKWLDNEHFGWLDTKIFEDKILLDFLDEDGNSLYKTEIKTN